ncbi:Sterile alpha motif domain-containing protein 3 [Aix galericulata]|nr:Sterile alpha motif domain-containing protein 3 [Aix galericulata]
MCFFGVGSPYVRRDVTDRESEQMPILKAIKGAQQEEEVSGAALLALNDRMVQQLVKKIGHQAVLMDLINKYQQQKNGPEPFTYYCESASPILPVISGDTERQILSTFSPVEQKLYLSSTENEEGLIDQRVLKQKYPNSQQYNFVVSALLQAYPFLDDDGNGFSVWKRALKDRFKYVRRTIEDDEQVLRNKCKFGHRRGQRRKSSSAENKPYDIKVLTEPEETDQPYADRKPAHQDYLRNYSKQFNNLRMTLAENKFTNCNHNLQVGNGDQNSVHAPA